MTRREACLVVAAALAALAGAAVWLAAEGRAWPVFLVERLLLQGKEVPPEALHAAWERAPDPEEALLPGRSLHYRSLLAVPLTADPDRPLAERVELLAAALPDAESALARDPADAHAWARLAYLRHGLHGPSPAVVAALRMSVYAAPAQPDLLNWRLELAARSRDYWDPDFADLVRSQLLRSWEANPRALARTAAASGLAPLAREALARDPDALARFEALLP
ncbi:MAG: hypothetical protein SCH98_18490 [Deferrisomatales bacterium]|nr:hypothetical protein [Deferrisomatales bacterium]